MDHKELAEYVKSTHKKLRLAVKQEIDPEAVWNDHKKDQDHLQKYAKSMHSLATEHWEAKDNVSRIKWARDAIVSYFFEGGLRSRTEKEQRKVSTVEDEETLELFKRIRSSLGTYNREEPLKVLDVGSCYDPFASFDEFDVTPIDLCPATTAVYQCDFLSLKIETEDELKTRKEEEEERRRKNSSQEIEPLDSFSDTVNKRPLDAEDSCSKRLKAESIPEKGSITELPVRSFDVVVFCLLLEYIPCPKLRFRCCLKAYELLKPNGVLCIITPDSKHDTANVHVFRLWKITLGLLGFNRIKYEKCRHFHGMLFRKGIVPSVWVQDARRELEEVRSKKVSDKFASINYDNIFDALYIIQDFGHE